MAHGSFDAPGPGIPISMSNAVLGFGITGPNNFATSTGFDRSSVLRQAWRKYMKTLDECEVMMRQARKEFDDVMDEVDRYLSR